MKAPLQFMKKRNTFAGIDCLSAHHRRRQWLCCVMQRQPLARAHNKIIFRVMKVSCSHIINKLHMCALTFHASLLRFSCNYFHTSQIKILALNMQRLAAETLCFLVRPHREAFISCSDKLLQIQAQNQELFHLS